MQAYHETMRLVAFGCSLTAGTGLDNLNQCWPSLLAEKMNLPLTVVAEAGISNKQILKNILSFDFQESDIAVILWTHPDRETIVTETGPRKIGTWGIPVDPLSRAYYDHVWNEHDRIDDMYTRIHHANHVIPCSQYHMLAAPLSQWRKFDWFNCKVLTISISKIREKHDYAPDGIHPDRHAYAEFAQRIYKNIQ